MDGAPEGLVYHYTTQAGLMGILDSKTLWASNLRHLNDRREFTFAMSVAERVLAGLDTDRYPTLIDYLMGQIRREGFDDTRTFVASFSERPDQLSQWRSYGGGGGFCLAFEAPQLEMEEAHYGRWGRCEYALPGQEELIREVLEPLSLPTRSQMADVVFEDLPEWRMESDQFLSEGLYMDIEYYAPLIKHPGFVEEAEWRIIAQPLDYPVEGAKWRAGPFSPTPYLEVSGVIAALREVIVGPNPEPRATEAAVLALLRATGFTDVEVKISDTPLRV